MSTCHWLSDIKRARSQLVTGGYYPSSLSPFLSSPSACSLSLLVLKSIPWAVIRVSSFSLWKLELLPLLIGGRTGSEYRPSPDFSVRFHSPYHSSKIHSCANVWDVKVEDYFMVNLEIIRILIVFYQSKLLN